MAVVKSMSLSTALHIKLSGICCQSSIAMSEKTFAVEGSWAWIWSNDNFHVRKTELGKPGSLRWSRRSSLRWSTRFCSSFSRAARYFCKDMLLRFMKAAAWVIASGIWPKTFNSLSKLDVSRRSISSLSFDRSNSRASWDENGDISTHISPLTSSSPRCLFLVVIISSLWGLNLLGR